ncbi:MAG: FAD:protein FMN transferase [Gammaproteobacteria bacterium]|nr:FAD:protein FMN transferase [Gammaproteobacteria bacterium]
MSYKKKPLLFFYLLFVVFFCKNQALLAQWVDHDFPIMGTKVTIRFWLDDMEKVNLAKEAVIAEMHRINNTMSPFIPDSLLSTINTSAADAPLNISDELFELIERSIKISDMTKGAFDITFSSVGYLYDYRLKQKPSSLQLEKVLPLINYQSIILDKNNNSIFFSQSGVKIDLGGIAKGLAVDNCINILKDYGVKDASVTAGGDTFVLGDNNGKMWQIGIRHPRAESKLISILPLADTAVSTSGDYERFFIEDGKRYHHILNPKTGKSVSSVQSVTIIADNSTLADALSTSVFVLGVKQGLQLVESLNNVSAIIVDNKGKMFYSADLAEL